MLMTQLSTSLYVISLKYGSNVLPNLLTSNYGKLKYALSFLLKPYGMCSNIFLSRNDEVAIQFIWNFVFLNVILDKIIVKL